MKQVSTNELVEINATTRGVHVVEFFMPSCSPCKILGPMLESVGEELPNISFYKVDVEEETDLADVYHITSVPTTILFKNGAPEARIEGLLPQSSYEQAIRSL